MTSLKQIEANRRNAQKSTGPRTEEGKNKSRNNALRHGMTCGVHVPLRHEEDEDLIEIRERMYAAWDPATDREAIQLEIVISQFMNIRRAERFEANFFDQSLAARQQKHGVPAVVSWNDDFGISMLMASKDSERGLRLIERYTRRAHKLYTEAVKLLEAMQRERGRQEDRQGKRHSVSRTTTANFAAPASPPLEMASFCEKTEPGLAPVETVPRC